MRTSIIEAFGEDPRVRGVTFDFTDGLITNWPTVVAGSDFDGVTEAAAEAGFGEQLGTICQQTLTLECAEFIMANLDSWAASALESDA